MNTFVYGQLNAIIDLRTVMLCNCIVRSPSIEETGLHNMFMGLSDSVHFCYSNSKIDKIGKKVRKNY